MFAGPGTDTSELLAAVHDFVAKTKTRHRVTPDPVLPLMAGGRLRDVENDTGERLYDGPVAVAAITGDPISVVEPVMREQLLVFGGWNSRRMPNLAAVALLDVADCLERFGFVGTQTFPYPSPTLAAYLKISDAEGNRMPRVIGTTDGFVAVADNELCESATGGIVVDAEDAPARRRRVRWVFEVQAFSPNRRVISGADISGDKGRGTPNRDRAAGRETS